MSVPVWPSELPKYPLINGYSSDPQTSVVGFDTEISRPILRNRSTAMPDFVSEPYVLDDAQKNILESFWKSTLNYGIVDFLKNDPESFTQQLYQFRSPPRFTKSGTFWTTTLELRRLP